jgi:GNAT superfamily N-acetyltransferase
MQIRKARLKDVEELAPLAIELMTHHKELTKNEKDRHEQTILVPNAKSLWKKWASKWIRSPKGLILIAEEDGEIAGYSMNFIKENIKVYSLRETGHLADLYVRKKFRKRGLATKFKQMAFSWFKKKGIKYASIAFHAKNTRAHKIYKKWGFFDYQTEMRMKL